MPNRGKSLIVCLDGTWVNSDNGYERPTLGRPDATLQIPTNVTRLYRALDKTSLDGKYQVVYYHSGVGSTGNFADVISGGAFGAGISEVGCSNVRF